MYVPPLLKMLCKLTHVTVVLSPVWLCCFIYDSMVWFCSRRLALSYTHTSLLNHPICYLSSLFMRFLEWLVTSFSFSFVYMLILSFHWWCIMIVFKMTSIRCNAHIRCHFRSYKTSYKSIFLYI